MDNTIKVHLNAHLSDQIIGLAVLKIFLQIGLKENFVQLTIYYNKKNKSKHTIFCTTFYSV